MMKHKQLIRSTVELLDSFNANIHGVQEHVDAYLSLNKVVVDAFYAVVGQNCLRVDRNLYLVLSYLALYRLDELGLSHFKKFVLVQDSNKMYRFLAFIFDENNIKTWMKDEWCKQYEQIYVKSKLISPLLRWLPELKELVSKLEDKQTNRQKPKQSKPATEPKPFNLTKPLPRSIPVPEKIPKLQKSKPVPETTYKQPKEEDTLSKVREANRKKAEDVLMRSSAKQFSCASAEKSAKTKSRMDRIKHEEQSKLQFNKSKYSELPSTTSGNIPIRLNAAAIMREGVLFEKKEEEEIKRLAEFEKGGRDPSEFLRWQENMRKKDMDDQLAEIEKRRLEGKLSYEEAILARQNLIRENQERVKQIKQETQEMMNEFVKKNLEQKQEMRQLVEDTTEGHQNTKEARKKLREFKQKIVQDVAKESQEMMKKALEEAEEEMRQKVALIAKIRAIESVPVIRFKYVDLTETSGAGLLGEMSIAELRERLSLLKMAESEGKEKKRDDILKSKVEKDQLLMDTLETIAKHRAEKGKEAAVRQEEKKRTQKLPPKDPKLQELQDKLEARKAVVLVKEEESIRKEYDERKIESQKMVQTLAPKKTSSRRQQELEREKELIEEMRWRELEKTREKAAKLRGDGLASRTSTGVRPVTKL
ncbi:hypothetical protein QZH41_009514, partial [Actinostola sp. cb2023]